MYEIIKENIDLSFIIFKMNKVKFSVYSSIFAFK